MRTVKGPPIPREDPPDESPIAEAPSTVRPPAGPALSAGRSHAPAATYQQLRESCRATATEEADLDDELAVEAEVLRVAMDRTRTRTGGGGGGGD